ncbi:MAG: efflux RND transporter permease subunit [Gemmatales bacterium]
MQQVSLKNSHHGAERDDLLTWLVRIFLDSKLSIILIIFSILVGLAVLYITPREEDPQIVVPLADIFVNFPGHSAHEVEQLVSTPLERFLYQIDGVEYVYSMSRENQAVITVRFYVGQDRERSLVKLNKKINENVDLIPRGVTGWVIKPIEIDDVPVVTLALTGSDSYTLRRIGEELVERFSSIPDISRAFVTGGVSRAVRIDLDPDKLQAFSMSPLEVRKALAGANITLPGGDFTRGDVTFSVEAGIGITNPQQLRDLVVGVFLGRPVFMKDVATVRDGPDETTTMMRHGWGPARGFVHHAGSPGTVIGVEQQTSTQHVLEARPAVTISLSKKKGTNAVAIADRIVKYAETLKEKVLPENVELVITRNYGLTADEKVNELVEALGVAILIVIALLTLSMGWRAAVVVAIAIPVVFGLTIAVNLLFGYTINRVTLFALILALGLLVDDPIVDVENIERHFEERKAASHRIVLEAVAEIRPPLISATLAVIVSFLPMFFITGMMGPYMAPMALNVPVSMFMSMVVAFTITPWLSYVMLKRKYPKPANDAVTATAGHHESYDTESIKKTVLYRLFLPLMKPLLTSRWRAGFFLLIIGALTIAAMVLAVTRSVPLKMLPFDNKNEFLLVLDQDEGTTLERTSAIVQEFETYLAQVPEVTDYSSFIGVNSPIDFNGLVRHYYLRQGSHLAEIRLNLVAKKYRKIQSHALTLRMRNDLTAIARKHQTNLKIVELPPGPPVLASVVAEVYGQADTTYEQLLSAADIVKHRFAIEPGIVDVDDVREATVIKQIFVPDQEKAALAGISIAELAESLRLALQGDSYEMVRVEGERQPLRIVVRLPRTIRSSLPDLSYLSVKGNNGQLVPLAELGVWKKSKVDQTIYHKNLERVVYVFGETTGRPPAECIVDVSVDKKQSPSKSFVAQDQPRAVSKRTYYSNGSNVAWGVPEGIRVEFAGEGEWKITLDVFRDLGLAFGAAMIMIYIILVAQTGSFLIPLIVMLAIPLTVLGVMPGFYLLNTLMGQSVGGFADPVYFTATAMIGMIALSGIVTRDSIILVDFIHQSVNRGRPLFDAIMESRVVRLRPILLTASAAMLSSLPITLDPIFSGLGWALIFGLIASTIFTLFVIPVTYWLVYVGNEGGKSIVK